MNIHAGPSGSELLISVHSRPPQDWPSAGAHPATARFTVFQSREFVDAWLQSFGQQPRWTPYFVAVHDAAGAPLMLLPLCIERRFGVRILGFIDQGHADYNAPVLFCAVPPTQAEMQALWQRILDALPAVDIVKLHKIPATVDGVPNPLRLLASPRDAESTHGNRLDVPWAHIERGMGNPRRTRKREKALFRVAPPQFVIAEDAESRERLLAQLIVHKQQTCRDAGIDCDIDKPEHLAFLRHATTAFARSGNLLLCAIVVGDEALAILWCLVHGQVALALVNARAGGAWERFSCGRILDHRLLAHLHERGFVYFDRGYGDEAYKLRASDTHVPLYRRDEARTLKGRFLIAARHLVTALRATRLFTWLRRIAVGFPGLRSNH